MQSAMVLPPIINQKETGRTLARVYELLSIIVGLYGHVAKIEPDGERKKAWGQLSDLAIADIGAIHGFWDRVRRLSPEESRMYDDIKLGQNVRHALRRVDMLQKLTNVWTPMGRWPRLLMRSENRWVRALNELGHISAELPAEFAPILERARVRIAQLKFMQHNYEKQSADYRKRFKVAKL